MKPTNWPAVLFLLLAIFLPLGAVYSQEAEDEVNEALQEEAQEAVQDAATEAVQGGATGTRIVVGALFPLVLRGDDDTNFEDSQEVSIIPRVALEIGLTTLALEIELTLPSFVMITDQETAEASFTGQTYSALVKFGEGIAFYIGFGLNQFSGEASFTAKGETNLANLGVDIEQDFSIGSGTQTIVGANVEIIEDVFLTFDYRVITFPLEITTRTTDLDSGVVTETEEDLGNIDHTFVSVGGSLFF